MNRLSISDRSQVIEAWSKASINATCRDGVAKRTVWKLLKDVGCSAASYHDSHVRNLRVVASSAMTFWHLYTRSKRMRPQNRWRKVRGVDVDCD